MCRGDACARGRGPALVWAEQEAGAGRAEFKAASRGAEVDISKGVCLNSLCCDVCTIRRYCMFPDLVHESRPHMTEMTNEGLNPKARPRKKSQIPGQGVEGVVKKLQALSLMPIHALAEGRNQSIPSLLHEMTGLSKARISKGNLDSIRPSTKVKVDRHLDELLQRQFKVHPEGLKRLRMKSAAAPVTHSGGQAPLAGWVHMIELLPSVPLSIAKDVALTTDELIEAILTHCRDDNLEGFKSVLLAHLERHRLELLENRQAATESEPESEQSTLLAIANWEQADNWTRTLVDHLYWDLISALDADWSSHYFSGRQARPLFPLVMVRPQEGLLETLKVKSRRNVYFKPVRRLLEFLYALVFYFRRKRWPAKAPKPKTLAGILYRPGSQEMADESLINNYFDGTTKVTLDLVLEHWEQLLHHFLPTRLKESERLNPPLPMIMLALQWQTLLIQDKGKSFLMPDMKRYETLWNFRRRQWAALKAQSDDGILKAGQPARETIDWPAWSFSQSSSS